MIVYCATSNSGKLREFQKAGGDVCTITPLPGLAELEAPEETGSTFEENAVIKALAYGAQTSDWLFAEDSGLEVDSLGGEPGVYSARYSGPGATDASNNALVLERLRGSTDRTARFVCVIALVRGGSLRRTFRGVVEGTITEAPAGDGGFGYDPIFFYPQFGCSFGEVERERKMEVSHRGAALREMVEWLASAGRDGDRIERE